MRRFGYAVLMVVWSGSVNALTFGSLFQAGAVLQRDCPIPVWGEAAPCATVTVRFAGSAAVGVADAAGHWHIELPPMPACGQSQVLEAAEEGAGIRLAVDDVLVGDVWLCSGQSNMHFRLRSDENAAAAIAASADPGLRVFMVDEQFGQRPMTAVGGAWQSASPETVAEFSAVAYYFGRDLRRRLEVPVGLVVSTVGGTKAETWSAPEVLAGAEYDGVKRAWADISVERFSEIADTYRAYQHARDVEWPATKAAAVAAGTAVPPAPKAPKPRCHDCPSALYFGMIRPLQPYALKGIAWYQGEANSGNPDQYRRLLPAMVANWRQGWQRPELPFLLVQLPAYNGFRPEFRQAQADIVGRLPAAGMAVTIDTGDAKDIHPRRKEPVGQRLALAARAVAYGESVSAGPVVESMRMDGELAVLTVGPADCSLHGSAELLAGFELAGADGAFAPAIAKLVEGRIHVSREGVSAPKAVRYAWKGVPEVSVFDQNNLPLAPFSSEHRYVPLPDGDWRLVFDDEFSGRNDEIDLDWEFQNGPSGHILSSRWRENAAVKDGTMQLLAKKETRAGQEWTAGNMWTRQNFQYGYFECRYRYAAAAGTNNSFWLMSPAKGDGAFEIDINEGHFPDEMNTNIHRWFGKHIAFHKPYPLAGAKPAEEFHVYGLLWTPEVLVWYFDGKEMRRSPNEFCHGPSPVRLSLAVIKWAGEVTDAIDGTSMDIDYVRVYRKQ